MFRRGDALVDFENPLAKDPPSRVYIPLLTPLTIDAKIAPVSPWALYPEPTDSPIRKVVAAPDACSTSNNVPRLLGKVG